MRLGGVEVPHDRQLVGHSDADVLLHAVTDAILGAAGLDDIGQWFPDTEAENRGRDSAEMLAVAHRKVVAAGFGIVNLDCVVLAQRPRLSSSSGAIRRRIAGILGLPIDRVGLKAKTGEQVGPVGREEVISVRCVTLLEHKDEMES